MAAHINAAGGGRGLLPSRAPRLGRAARACVPPELGGGESIVKPVGIDDVPIATFTLWTPDPERGASELNQVSLAAVTTP